MHFLIAEMHFMHKQQWVIVFIWLRWPLQLFSDLESASLKMSFILREIFFKILFLYDAFDFYQILQLKLLFEATVVVVVVDIVVVVVAVVIVVDVVDVALHVVREGLKKTCKLWLLAQAKGGRGPEGSRCPTPLNRFSFIVLN